MHRVAPGYIGRQARWGWRCGLFILTILLAEVASMSRQNRRNGGLSLVSFSQPRPTNGIFVAITVMNCTLASSGRLAI